MGSTFTNAFTQNSPCVLDAVFTAVAALVRSPDVVLTLAVAAVPAAEAAAVVASPDVTQLSATLTAPTSDMAVRTSDSFRNGAKPNFCGDTHVYR